MDETNFVDPSYIVKVVFPMYMIEGTVLVFMSSPIKEPCIINHLSSVKDARTGRLLFKTVLLVEVCEECQKKKEGAEFCEHMLSNRSDLKNQRRMDEISMAYPNQYKDIRDQEILGVTTKGSNVLPPEYIKRFLENRVIISSRVGVVFVGIDPGGGGISHTGISVAARYPTAFRPGLTVVCNLCIVCFYSRLFLFALGFHTPGGPSLITTGNDATSISMTLCFHIAITAKPMYSMMYVEFPSTNLDVKTASPS